MALDSESFNRFFDLVEVANFEIASDAFASFKVRQQRKGAWGYEPQQAAAPRSARGMQRHFAPGSSCVVLRDPLLLSEIFSWQAPNPMLLTSAAAFVSAAASAIPNVAAAAAGPPHTA